MPFQIVHNDITKMHTDAIVNAANSALQMGGGVCGTIFIAAGAEKLQSECKQKGKCPVGHAVITKGYALAAKYVIHAVGPVWNGGNKGEAKYLAAAYGRSLEIAKEHHLESISFPLISSGIYGYPKEEVLQIAIATISEFLLHNDMDVYLVVLDRKVVSLSEKLFSDISSYIDTYYEDTENSELYQNVRDVQSEFLQEYKEEELNKISMPTPINESATNISKRSLEEVLSHMDETFSEMLLRIIDEKGKGDVEVYKKANIDRKLFSKIRSNKDYNPKKTTILALAIALELSLDEIKDLLSKAGYSLSSSHKFDVIIQYFIEAENYDIFTINEALFCFEQSLLGA
ncbi:macro domain-containing protein [Clostridium vincentii]|uniref:O-acetyl-ADP-ribose deacetylase n=1 Tax=Clostridium vincentii TaxID=52704 RepID=A0A2T0B929_9CLOT|nr:macro domain-containing protein [Clostridium vincentii]PRR80365.1 O-acetyl-ADP-ribose deacetylase [Clostridium vincentii]